MSFHVLIDFSVWILLCMPPLIVYQRTMNNEIIYVIILIDRNLYWLLLKSHNVGKSEMQWSAHIQAWYLLK